MGAVVVPTRVGVNRKKFFSYFQIISRPHTRGGEPKLWHNLSNKL